jgi:hypothetical protein
MEKLVGLLRDRAHHFVGRHKHFVADKLGIPAEFDLGSLVGAEMGILVEAEILVETVVDTQSAVDTQSVVDTQTVADILAVVGNLAEVDILAVVDSLAVVGILVEVDILVVLDILAVGGNHCPLVVLQNPEAQKNVINVFQSLT